MNVKDKNILITGASGDIGIACAEMLLAAGATLILHSNSNRAKVDGFASRHKRASIYHINCNATNEKEVKQQFQYLSEKVGIKKLDVLVNNAGDLISRCCFADMEWDLMEAAINVNLKSSFLFTKYALQMMTKGASIIFMSSLTARWGKGDRSTHYGTSKSAILGFAKCLANELASEGIRVNSIAPGFIEGNFHDRYTKPIVAKEHMGRNPLSRNGKPEDVAGAVLFLASDSSGYVNGTTIDVCGGDFIC